MLAVELRDYAGRPASLAVRQLPMPQPGPNQVLVRMAAAPINPSDLMFLRGEYGIRKALPCVPGFEGSGTVVAAGPGLYARQLVGRRVACIAPDTGGGTWAEYLVTDAGRCFPISAQVSFTDAACLVVNPLTALALVEQAAQGGHRALIQTAAASQVGRMILRLANERNLPLINIVRRPEQVELLRSLNAAYVLNSSLPDFSEQLRLLATKLQATLAVDAVAGATSTLLLEAMPPHSTLIVYGGLDPAPIRIDYAQLLFQGKALRGFWLADWATELSMVKQVRLVARLNTLVQGTLATSVQAHYPLAEILAALDQYQQSMSAGKVLLMMESAAPATLEG